MITTLLASALALALVPPASCPPPPLSATDAALAREQANALRTAETRATEDPEHGVELLRAALDQARAAAAVVARDPDATEARQYAMLALARGLVVEDDRAAASAILDIALATAAGDELPSRLFGPSLGALHDERKAAIAATSTATLNARCTGPCLVIVDAAPVGCAGPDAPAAIRLPPGTWEVVLVDAKDPTNTVAKTVDLVGARQAEVTLAVTPPAAEPRKRRRDPATVTPGDTVAEDGGRKVPRWAGILGIAVGVAAMVAGGVLVAVDGNCPDGADPMGPGACRNVLATDLPGYVVLGVGAAATVGFSVVLGVGEGKQAKARRARAAQPNARLRGTGVSIRF